VLLGPPTDDLTTLSDILLRQILGAGQVGCARRPVIRGRALTEASGGCRGGPLRRLDDRFDAWRRNGPGEDHCLDIARLTRDTGFAPAFDVAAAVADYVAWRSDNPRCPGRSSPRCCSSGIRSCVLSVYREGPHSGRVVPFGRERRIPSGVVVGRESTRGPTTRVARARRNHGWGVLETLKLGPDRLVCLLVRGAGGQAHRVVGDPPLQQHHHDSHSSSVVPTLASAPAR
jgi:hypothetical protein